MAKNKRKQYMRKGARFIAATLHTVSVIMLIMALPLLTSILTLHGFEIIELSPHEIENVKILVFAYLAGYGGCAVAAYIIGYYFGRCD